MMTPRLGGTRIRPPSYCRPVAKLLESLSLRISYAKRMLVAPVTTRIVTLTRNGPPGFKFEIGPMQASHVSLLMLLLTPVVSFPVAFTPTFTDSRLHLSFRQKRTVSSFALRGLRGGFVADAQQHIFAAARREASKTDLVSQKASVSTEFENPPPAPGSMPLSLQTTLQSDFTSGIWQATEQAFSSSEWLAAVVEGRAFSARS